MTPTVGQALAQSGLVPVDAHALLAHVTERNRAWLAAHRDEALAREQADAFFALAKRRREGEPVAYLVGWREFWGLRLRVTPDVLIPRPETETLVELALTWLAPDRALRVLDLGTGSGAIALALAHERPQAHVIATDASSAALAIARDNAQQLGLDNVEFVGADWYDGVPSGTFDLIVSNPPYIASDDPHLEQGDLRFEPRGALTDDADGLSAIRVIVQRAPFLLAPGGALWLEHGYDQAEAVRALLTERGLTEVRSATDLAGIERISGGVFTA